MKHGFALIDLLISIAISGIMSIVIFTLIFQIQKSEEVVNEIVSSSMQAALVGERMQKDFMGMFWPIFIPKKPEQIKNKPEEVQKKEETKETEQVNIKKILYSENIHTDSLDVLKEASFITCNPLQIYNNNIPRVVRVIYRLEPDLQYSDSFNLYRQESIDLDYNQAKSQTTLQSFILTEGLRSLNLTYIYQQGDQVEKTVKELDYDSSILEQDLLNELVPNYVKLELSFWEDAKHQDYKEYDFWFYINAPYQKNPLKKNPQQSNKADETITLEERGHESK